MKLTFGSRESMRHAVYSGIDIGYTKSTAGGCMLLLCNKCKKNFWELDKEADQESIDKRIELQKNKCPHCKNPLITNKQLEDKMNKFVLS